MTQSEACTAFKMARMAFNQYRREIAAGESHGTFVRDWHAALAAMAQDYVARFPDAAEDGYFKLPRRD
jgi:hypothetical protein